MEPAFPAELEGSGLPCRVQEILPRLFLLDPGMSGRYGYTSLYLVAGERVALLDAGVSVNVPAVLSAIFRLGIKADQISYLVLSHAHYDHAGGAWALVYRLRDLGNQEVKVVCGEKPAVYLSRADLCEKLLRAGKTTEGKWAGEMRPLPREDFLVVGEGDELELGPLSLQVIDTPGHANGHLVFFSPQLSFLFAGDTCGLLGKAPEGEFAIAPTAFAPEYRHDLYVASLRRIAKMNLKHLGFAHFGVLPNPRPWLEQATEQTERLRNLALSAQNGRLQREEAIKIMEEMFSPALFSLYPDRERLLLTLKSMLAGFLHDLSR